jgi:hypothetical protein
LESRNSTHTDVTPEQNETWKQWHLELLKRSGVSPGPFAARMAEHQIPGLRGTSPRSQREFTMDYPSIPRRKVG